MRPLEFDTDFLLGGIQVNEEGDVEGWLDALQAAGMNTISVTDYAHQGDWDTENLWWDPNPGLLTEIRAARARGMRVVLILRLALDHAFPRNRFMWHGMIMPQSEDQLGHWFSRYSAFLRYWAEIAEREDIDALMIGSELNALTATVPLSALPVLEDYFLDDEKQAQRKQDLLSYETKIDAHNLWINGRDREEFPDLEAYLDARIAAEQGWAARITTGDVDPATTLDRLNRQRAALEGHWLALIDCVRGLYSGQLGYAANFDAYQDVGFWDRLDVMGINAYFKLRDHLVPQGDRAALGQALTRGWQTVVGDIATFRDRHNLAHLPIVFTEMGFTPRANSTIETWADKGFAQVKRHPDSDSDDLELVIWNEQVIDRTERALAVEALDGVRRARHFPLRGVLYWKLSSKDYHEEIEPFLLLIGQEKEDPLLTALRRLATP